MVQELTVACHVLCCSSLQLIQLDILLHFTSATYAAHMQDDARSVHDKLLIKI